MANPVPSDKLTDLQLNAKTTDTFVNSDELNVIARPTPTDPTGKVIRTLAGIDADVELALQRIGVQYSDPITNWEPTLLVNAFEAHRYPATTGDIYIPTAPLPFTTGATFDSANWMLLQGVNSAYLDSVLSDYVGIKTLAEAIADTSAQDGDYVRISDLKNKLWQYQARQTENETSVWDCNDVTLSLVLYDTFEKDVEVYGADASGVDDVLPSVTDALSEDGTCIFPSGTFNFDSGRYLKQVTPQYIKGNGCATTLNIGVNNVDSTVFRLAAIGGVDRVMTKLEGLNFTADSTGTAIDAQAVFPITLSDFRCFDLGMDAIKYYQIYYGRAENIYFWGSGINFTNVNNYTFAGGDFHGEKEPLVNHVVTDYASTLDDCDRITFSDLTFEGYKTRVMKLKDCKTIHYRDAWFEANTADHLIKAESCQDIHFTQCYMELEPNPTSSFILVDNSNVIGINRTITTLINFNGGYARLDTSTSSNFKLVDISGAGRVRATFDNYSFRSGSILMHYDATMKVTNSVLSTTTGSTDEMKFIESIPVADIANGKNNWLLGSEMSDKGMIGGAIVTDETSGGSDAVITTDSFTDQNGISTKVTIPAAETDEITLQRLCSDLTTITTEGETYVFFVRCYCTANLNMQIKIAGNILDYQVITPITTKTNQWIDYVIKTDSSQTWSLGSTGSQKIKILLTNDSGVDVDFYLDRIDYKSVLGDHYLP